MTSLNALGYGADSLATDKYWQMYQAQMLQQYQNPTSTSTASQAGLTSQANTSATTNLASANVAFGDTIPRATEMGYANDSTEQSSGIKKGFLLGAGLLATGAACIISKGKAGTKWFSAERWKTGWNAIKKDWFRIGKKAGKDLSNKITAQKIDKNWVVTMPNKTQTIAGKDISKTAKQLGIEVNPKLALTDKGAKLNSTWLEFKYDKYTNKALYKDGKIVKLFGQDGKPLTASGGLQSEISKIETALSKGEIPTGINLTKTRYSFGSSDSGTIVNYVTNMPDKAKNGLLNIKTNRYLATDTNVQAFANDNKEFSTLLKQITAEKPNYSGWAIGKATYQPKGLPKDTQIIIENGAISGIKAPNKAGKIEFFDLNSDTYKALHNQYSSIFNDAMKHQQDFKNVIYAFA